MGDTQLLLYNSTPYVSAETALFSALIKSGEDRAHITLPANLKMFLLGCLTEHLCNPDIVHRVLALDFYGACLERGAERERLLKHTGDASLILAGLYPERVLRLNVKSVYFRYMGRSAYSSLAAHLEVRRATIDRSRLYQEVTQEFVALEQVLKGARGRAENEWDANRRIRAQLNF
ncbi:MAG: hypothetical protein WAW00_03550 [Candidatus Moraniibacteriota bacterium]